MVVLQFSRKLQKNGDGLEEKSERGKKELGGGLGPQNEAVSQGDQNELGEEKALRCTGSVRSKIEMEYGKRNTISLES